MTNSSKTDEAPLCDVDIKRRTSYRKRHSPSGGNGGVSDNARDGIRKYCRHDTLTLRALMAGKVSAIGWFPYACDHVSQTSRLDSGCAGDS